uniref:Gag-Pol polyprotein n=1 Tax=Tanacetum cinerariifolium TaxID=118510 RepID=A0A699HHV0_TANCI|nr:hypothetical protein [Tanacetum cinerariifolium]
MHNGDHVPAVPITENSPAVPEHTTVETLQTMSPENKARYESEKEAIILILTGIGVEIYSTECRKLKRVKDSTYHKEKMLLCKQAEQGVPLQAEHVDWLADTDDEIDKQELEAHYSFMAKIQEVVSPESNSNAEPLEQTDQNVEDKRVALANLIANLKLDVDKNKNIQKQLKKANTSLAHELEQFKSILAETSKTLEESNRIQDSCLVALQTKQTEFEKYKACNDRTVAYDKLERKLNETLGLLAQKDIDIKEGLKFKAYEILVVKEKHDELVPDREETLTLAEESRSKLNKDFMQPYDYTRQAVSNTKVIKPGMYRFENRTTQTRAPQLPQTSKNTNPRLSTSTRVAHKTNVSRPQLRSNQMTDKVVPNNSHVKAKKTKVEDHHRISSISNKTKSVTACNDSLKSETLNANAVCATCGKCLIDSNQFSCVTKLLHDMNAGTKKPNIVPISTRKPKIQAKKSVATPHKKIVASKTTTQKSKS